MNRLGFLILLLLISMFVFYVANTYVPSTLNSKDALARDLMSDPDYIYKWKINDEAPFKYRILFKTIVQGSYEMLVGKDDASKFFTIYKTWSALFFCLTPLAFLYFLESIGFKLRIAFLGCLLMIFSIPYSVAYALPIHTREDVLGYLILVAGLISTVKSKPIFVLILSVLGFLCRETLLILPLFYFFFARNEKNVIKFGLPILSILLYISYRILSGVDLYDVTLGLCWNLDNPSQLIGFLFLTFGFLWLPFIHSMIRWKKMVKNENQVFSFILKSSPYILILILLTTFLGGIFNEIRLIYLSFPWIIAVSVNYYNRYANQFFVSFHSLSFVILSLVCLLIFASVGFFLFDHIYDFIEPSKYGISYKFWITLTLIHIYMAILSLPIHIKIERAFAIFE